MSKNLKASIAKNVQALVEGRYEWGMALLEDIVGWSNNDEGHTYEVRGRAIVMLLDLLTPRRLRMVAEGAAFYAEQMRSNPQTFECEAAS